jgi:F0F1-type ATP synthase epsilon subunit
MTETGTDPGALVGTWYAEANKEADRREAHKAKRAAEQEANASGADVGHGR